MARTKGSPNKTPSNHPDLLDMTVEERLEFVTNLIVEQILELQRNDFALLKELGIEGYDRQLIG